MIRIMFGMLAMTSWAWFLSSCGSNEKNPCDNMQEKIEKWSTEYCRLKTLGKTEENIKSNCCTCFCLLLDQEMDQQSAQTCVCMEPSETEDVACEDDALEAAQTCLENLDACRQENVNDAFDTICYPAYGTNQSSNLISLPERI